MSSAKRFNVFLEHCFGLNSPFFECIYDKTLFWKSDFNHRIFYVIKDCGTLFLLGKIQILLSDYKKLRLIANNEKINRSL